MYFKSITLQGFKSFAEKTTLEFTGGITAVVGPNGSGKSNISDAIRWVMGEMSAKTLRGSKMEDVIFGGTEKRKPLGFAEVTITLDNSKHQFDIEYEEVSVTRRVYRSGESEYYINKAPCRLRDIHELFMDTGLGRDGYSIIGQGKIDAILSAKSEERRHIFDEAAGITKYRYRKLEAEKKLAHTEENLLRANDIITELESRIGTLKRQCETAKKYLELYDIQKNTEVNLWLYTIDQSGEKLRKTKTDFENLKSQMDSVSNQIESQQAEINRLRDTMRIMDSEIDKSKAQMYQSREAVTRLKGENDVIAANIANNIQSIYRIEGEIAQCNERIKMLSDLSKPQSDFEAGANKRKNAVMDIVGDLQNQAMEVANDLAQQWNFKASFDKTDDFETTEKTVEACIEQASKAYNTYINDLANAKSDINTLKNRRAILLELENEFEGYSKGIKGIMNEHSYGKLRSNKIYGPVSTLIETEAKYVTAVEAAAGNNLNNIVTETEDDAKAAIEYLKKNNLGRVTFMPVSSVKGREMKDSGYDKCKGFLAVASDVIKNDSKFDGVVSQILGGTVIVDTFDNAVAMARKFGYSFKIATLAGEILNPGGSITGGTATKTTGGLSRRSEIAEVEEKIKKAEELLSQDDMQQQNLLDKNENARSIFNDIKRKYWEQKLILQSIEKDFEMLKERADEANAEKAALEKSIKEKKNQIKQHTDENEENKKKAENNEETAKSLSDSATELEEKIKQMAEDRETAEKTNAQQMENLQSLNSQLSLLTGEQARLEAKITKLEEDAESLVNRLWDEYELTYLTAEKYRHDIEDVAAEHKNLASVKAKIKALGNVNLDAIEEYAASSERYEFLITQRDDILNAKAELENLIGEITETMTQLFEENFAVLKETFKETFKELFGGGDADLSLSNPQEILESGVEINVQPPGKKLQSITLLSGGEKAFTAIALIFAILKINPTQFCVFDEIEAALDDVNVFRYADYLKRLCDHTQFIVITHRKGTMEAADTLYGVTMQEKGVTRMVSLDMNSIQE